MVALFVRYEVAADKEQVPKESSQILLRNI
jgi:hypothetical protein